MRVLVVDNNIELCRALKEYFDTQPDFEVVGLAYDGEQALIRIECLRPDVVLLDITMPHLDGLGVMERLQTMELAHRPTVFAITAFGSDNLLARLMALGADYFMVKPFRLEILAQRLREFAGRSGKMFAAEGACTLESRITLDQKVSKLLHDMGIPPHYKGFTYLKDAVLLCNADGYFVGGLTKEIYPALATKYHTTASGVEAAIRNAVAAAWEHGNTSYIRRLCDPYCDERMPTNSLIIAKIAEESLIS